MAIFLKILKWGIGIVMGLTLLVCLIDIFAARYVFKMPKDVNDLVWIDVTVKEKEFTYPRFLTLHAEDVAAVFPMILTPDQMKSMDRVSAGDIVGLDIKKEDAENLNSINVAQPYGFRLRDGQKIFDDSGQIEKTLNNFRRFIGKICIVPIIYFSALILWNIRLRKSGNVSRKSSSGG